MEEMRNMLRHRHQGEGPPFKLRTGVFDSSTREALPTDVTRNFIRSVDVLVTEADKDLMKALSNQDTLQNELARLANEFKGVRLFCSIVVSGLIN